MNPADVAKTASNAPRCAASGSGYRNTHTRVPPPTLVSYIPREWESRGMMRFANNDFSLSPLLPKKVGFSIGQH